MPSSSHSGRSSRRAFRSHRATSTAAIAIEPIPGRPRLRTARTIARPRRLAATARRTRARRRRAWSAIELGRRDVGVAVAEPALAAGVGVRRRRSWSAPSSACRRPRARRSGPCRRADLDRSCGADSERAAARSDCLSHRATGHRPVRNSCDLLLNDCAMICRGCRGRRCAAPSSALWPARA